MLIRKEEKRDFDEIRNINNICFNGEYESKLADNIRKGDNFILSLVAEDNGKIAGHIMYSRIKIGDIDSVALAPMCVLPEYQKKGIGTDLIKESFKYLIEMNEKNIVVLGHTDFYSRLGFEKAADYGVKCPFTVPDEVFMVIELEKGSLKAGVVEYGEEFSM
ncbi:GNAT family N-acetyltransferase [Sebaldella sp. S0638]|uniref:GNAT family N-acetyltransferase n=1 Tax=Sebaldella sp. S0638 TaxID=2957809 RepID=UPI00209E9CAA|nr:N-acetyltransferase [Sebaldella sp. S0638]MCP1224985.1 N-acetyltransferase [Sebaldella sp. S0638]